LDLLGKVGSLVSVNHILIFQIINFSILLFILYKLLYNPLISFMDKRSEKIESSLKEAADRQQEATELQAKANADLALAKKEAYELLQTMRSQGESAKEDILKAGKEQAESLIVKARDEIELETKKAKENLRAEVASISVTIAEKLLKREVKANDQDRFIEECLKELELRD